MRYEGLMALAIFCISFPFAPPAFAQQKSKQHQKWEYKTVDSSNSEDRKIDIQQLGEEGWELVKAEASGNGLTYYFKRPKGADSKQVSKQPPQQPTAPQCSVPLDKAPTIRGLRLGMSAEELLPLFSLSYGLDRAQEALKNAGSPPNYGLAIFSFNSFGSGSNELKEKFAGISDLSFMTLDGRVVEIRVSYGSGNPRLPPSWTIDEWTAKVSDTFSLPGANNWQPNNYLRTLKCKELEVVTMVSPRMNQSFLGVGGWSMAYMTITDPSYRQIVEQRAKSDQEKKQREFVF